MASRPLMVVMPFLLIVAPFMAMLVSSKIAEPEMTKISSINLSQLSPNQLSNEKILDIPGLQQCWASFSRIGGCIDEINLTIQVLRSGGGGGGEVITGLIGPVCCDVVKVMHEHCWPQMLPDPFFIKINFFCAHHHHSIPKRPTPVGPPLPAPQVPAPAPAPQDPSPAPAPPPQSPTPPQYSYPAPPAPQVPSPAPAPQDPPPSPTPPQYSYPAPPVPQYPLPSPPPPQYLYPNPPATKDPLPSPTTPQYPSPTPPGPPCPYCHGAQP